MLYPTESENCKKEERYVKMYEHDLIFSPYEKPGMNWWIQKRIPHH